MALNARHILLGLACALALALVIVGILLITGVIGGSPKNGGGGGCSGTRPKIVSYQPKLSVFRAGVVATTTPTFTSTPPVTFSLRAGAPTWIQIDSESGVITSSATEMQTEMEIHVDIKDTYGSASFPFMLGVLDNMASYTYGLPDSLIEMESGTVYKFTPQPSEEGFEPKQHTFVVSPTFDPALGVSLDAGNGSIAGTAGRVGVSATPYRIGYLNGSMELVDVATLILSVSAPYGTGVALTEPSAVYTYGDEVSNAIVVTGGRFESMKINRTLPNGLFLDGMTAVRGTCFALSKKTDYILEASYEKLPLVTAEFSIEVQDLPPTFGFDGGVSGPMRAEVDGSLEIPTAMDLKASENMFSATTNIYGAIIDVIDASIGQIRVSNFTEPFTGTLKVINKNTRDIVEHDVTVNIVENRRFRVYIQGVTNLYIGSVASLVFSTITAPNPLSLHEVIRALESALSADDTRAIVYESLSIANGTQAFNELDMAWAGTTDTYGQVSRAYVGLAPKVFYTAVNGKINVTAVSTADQPANAGCAVNFKFDAKQDVPNSITLNPWTGTVTVSSDVAMEKDLTVVYSNRYNSDTALVQIRIQS